MFWVTLSPKIKTIGWRLKTLDTREYRLNYGRSDDINEQKSAIFVYVWRLLTWQSRKLKTRGEHALGLRSLLVEPVVTNTGYYWWPMASGTIYTTHSIKRKASSLTLGLCGYFYWINALKFSEVCFTSRHRFSICAQSLVVYYIIHFFYLFSFYIIVFKTIFKFYFSRGIRKIK